MKNNHSLIIGGGIVGATKAVASLIVIVLFVRETI